MTPDTIIEEPRLREITGYNQRAALMRWLDRAGIRYKVSRKGVWTTQHWIDRAFAPRGEQELDIRIE